MITSLYKHCTVIRPSTAERQRHWQFCHSQPVHNPNPSCSAHLWTQSPRFSTWVAQCPKTVVTVLRCHPGLSKPRRHLALSTEGCGCRRRSTLSLSSVSSLLSPCQLSYELECTSLLEPEAHCLQCFVMCCFRIILPISIWDNKHNISIWKAAKQQRVSSLLSQYSYTLQDI